MTMQTLPSRRAVKDQAANLPPRPLRYIPQRLSAAAICETLDRLGIKVPIAVSASAAQTRDDLAMSIRASGYQIDEAKLDKALTECGIALGERLRFKFSCDAVGLLYAKQSARGNPLLSY